MRALRFTLAIELAADYGVMQYRHIVAKGARDSKAAVARANSNELAFITPDPTVLARRWRALRCALGQLQVRSKPMLLTEMGDTIQAVQ